MGRRRWHHWRSGHKHLVSNINMNKILKFIKGSLLTLLAIAVFSLSIGPAVNTSNETDVNTSVYEVSIGDNAFAQADKKKDTFVDDVLKAGDENLKKRAELKAKAEADAKAKTDAKAGSDTKAGTDSGDSSKKDSTKEKPKEASLPEDTVKKIAAQSQIIFKIFHPAIFFFTKHISNLMGTDLIFGEGMGKMLKEIWIVNRNIVNIAFVLILLFMALKYIFGNDENTDLKKLLPMFALALIAVNFTWLGSKLIIDSANVATNVVFAIPKGMGPVKGLAKTKDVECKIKKDGSGTEGYGCALTDLYYPTKAGSHKHMKANECKTADVAGRYKAAYGGLETTDGSSSGERKDSPFYGRATYCWENLDLAKYDNTNAAYHLTYGMARVQNLPVAKAGEKITDVAIGTLFAFIIEIIYLLTFLALFIALVFRVAFLWILVAFSPFIVLLMFLGKLGAGGEGGDIKKYLSLQAFASWAFAPAKVAAVWTVGFIMITAGQLSTTNIFAKLDNQGLVTGKVYQVSSLFNGIETIQELMWLIMTIIIIWMGTFAVLSKLEAVGPLLDKINQKGIGVAKFVASSPKWAPIIPTIDPNTGKMDWKNRTSIAKFEREIHEKVSAYTGGHISPNREKQILDKYRKASNINQLRDSKDGKSAYGHLVTASGMTHEEIKGKSQDELKNFLNEHPEIKKSGNAADLAKGIHDHARTQKTVDKVSAPVPPKAQAASAKTLSQPEVAKAVEDGVVAGLQRERFAASQQDIKKAVDELKKSSPKLTQNQAIVEVIKKLKATPGVVKPLPQTTGTPAQKQSTPKKEGGNTGGDTSGTQTKHP